MSKNSIPTCLVILDGFGYSKSKQNNPIKAALTPNLNSLIKNYSNTLLQASGKYVGLLPNKIGNSEVGHLTIGAGKVIQQSEAIINNAIKDKSFFSNKVLLNNLRKLNQNNSVHIIGLLSDAGVHSDIETLKAFIDAAVKNKVNKIFLHLILDGRDTKAEYALNLLAKIEKYIKNHKNISIGSLQGRYYAMDRDNNWQRIEKSYDILTKEEKIKFKSYNDVVNYYYSKNVSDEFIPPTRLNHEATIKNHDGVIFINYRQDRARELTSCFVDKQFKHFPIKKINLKFFITPIDVGNNLKTQVMFKIKPVKK